MKFKFKVRQENYTAWYLIPAIRFGLYDRGRWPALKEGGFIAFTFLKFDAVFSWTKEEEK